MVVFPIGENNEDSTSGLSPSTVTVIKILSDVSTPTPSHSTTIQSNSLTSISTTAFATSVINSSPSRISTPTPTPTSSTSLASSVSPSSSSLSPQASSASGAPLSKNNKTFSKSSLNSGAIAGIVIACVFIFLVGSVFAIRIWSKKKRASKLNKIWSRSMVGMRYGIAPSSSSYDAKLASGNGNSHTVPLSVQIPSPHVSVPPISYNNDAVFQYSTTPVTSSTSVLTSPVYLPGLMSLSPYSTTVVCTFIPSLPDELTISIGETLRVLAGYEDGWSLCMNSRGKQGMVPNECLEESFSSMGLLPPNRDYRISRSSARVSSLAQAVRLGR